MNKNVMVLSVVLSALLLQTGCVSSARAIPGATIPRAEFRIRDPFVLADEGVYYLYESKPWDGGRGVFVRRSTDLEHWTDKQQVMHVADNLPVRKVWAPEVHKYKGSYYLFVTLTLEQGAYPVAALVPDREKFVEPRGTWVYKAASPMGPFTPVKKGPVPPQDWMTLDGTLYEEDGQPYMVFCHEWCQVRNGGMCALPLTDDLSAAAGSPIYLFSASDAPWAPKKEIGADGSFPMYVTDGPFMYRGKDNRLFMLWSSFGPGDYTVGLAESKNGKIDGEWFQHEKPVYENGGHCMLFKDFDGNLRMSLHGPNRGPLERAHFLRLVETDEGLLRVAP